MKKTILAVVMLLGLTGCQSAGMVDGALVAERDGWLVVARVDGRGLDYLKVDAPEGATLGEEYAVQVIDGKTLWVYRKEP